MLLSEEEGQRRRAHPLLLLRASLSSPKVCAEALQALRRAHCDVTKGTDNSTVATGQPATRRFHLVAAFVFRRIREMWKVQ